MNQKRRKTVNYRRADIFDKDNAPISKSLQKLIEEALTIESIECPFKFPYDQEQNPNSYLLLFTKKDRKPYYRDGCLCGCVSFYDEDMKIPLIDATFVKDELFTEEVSPKDSKNKKRNLEQDPIYFAIKDNHVALVMSNMHGLSVFNDFLHILLQDKANLLNNGGIRLTNIPTQEALAKMKGQAVKSFSFSTAGYTKETIKLTPNELTEAKRKGENKRVRKIFRQSSLLKSILTLFKGESILERLTDTQNYGQLSIAVEFIYKSKNNEEGQEILNDMAYHFGSQEGLNTVINLSDKSTIKQNELTIKGEVEILAANRNLNKTNAYSVIAAWLTEKIRSGQV